VEGAEGLASFEAIVAAMDAAWDSLLGAVQVSFPVGSGGSEETEALNRGFQSAAASGGSSSTQADAPEPLEALEAFLKTPQGVALALQNEWVTVYPEELLEAVRLLRGESANGENFAATSLAAVALAAAPRLAANLSLAASSLAKGAVAYPQVSISTNSDLEVLYTLLYMSLCAPSTLSDADGGYLGFDFLIHTPPPGLPSTAPFLSDLSLWDTHRSQAPLMALVAPRLLADAAGSLLLMAEQGGKGMPRWPFANLYTGDMVAHHGFELLVDCVLVSHACDGRVSVESAAAAVLAEVSRQDASLPDYVTLGFVPSGQGSASETLEWAYNDNSASLFAQVVGNATLASLLANRAQSWRRVLTPGINGVGVIAPRAENGTFDLEPSIWYPHPFNTHYTEGSAAQWTWSVPHALQGLVEAFPGGVDSYASFLQGVLVNQTQWTSVLSTFLPNPWCWLGNEPSMLLPWQHAAAGPAYLPFSQFWPRWHLRTYFAPGVDLVPGNGDYGTLDAWGVWAYLGLYPVAATRRFIVGSPVVETATIAAPAAFYPYAPGSPHFTLSIRARNASPVNIYVAAVRVNGATQPLLSPFIFWEDLWPNSTTGTGGTAVLEFEMVSQPTPWR